MGTNMLQSTQTGFVHIDKLKVILPCVHRSLGNKKWKLVDSETGEIRFAASRQKGSLDYHESTYFVQSKKVQPNGIALELELSTCPPKMLQRHNVFGHSNLIQYVLQAMDKLVDEPCFNHVKIRPEDRLSWQRGDFRVLEAHLTANFGCPRELVLSIINAIDAANGEGKHRNLATSISLGFNGAKRSASRVVTVYDKYLEREGVWKQPGVTRQELLKFIQNSIRVEVKLYSTFLKKYSLASGADWRDKDVSALFFRELDSFNLWTTSQRALTPEELRKLNAVQRNAYIAWIHGTEFSDLFDTRQTASKHAKTILDVVGQDIREPKRPKALEAIETSKIFAPENILAVPDWLKNSQYFVGE
jgi:II/X family phage/plasmid replication protein